MTDALLVLQAQIPGVGFVAVLDFRGPNSPRIFDALVARGLDIHMEIADGRLCLSLNQSAGSSCDLNVRTYLDQLPDLWVIQDARRRLEIPPEGAGRIFRVSPGATERVQTGRYTEVTYDLAAHAFAGTDVAEA